MFDGIQVSQLLLDCFSFVLLLAWCVWVPCLMIAFRSGAALLGSRRPTGATRRDGCSLCSLIASVKLDVWKPLQLAVVQAVLAVFLGLKGKHQC